MKTRILTALCVLSASAVMSTQAVAAEVRVGLVGKTPAAAYAAIARAARTVCRLEVGDAVYSIYLRSNCVADTVEATLAKIGDPALLQYSQARKTFLVAAN